ncbi:MAG: BON domain-containing protein [Thermogutta sp.]|nr:BON domain-containing protein [Thermogutta sp.]
MNLGNVNTATQMLGTTSNQSFVGADSSDISNVMSMLQGTSGRTGTRSGTTGLSSFGLNSRGLSGLTGSRGSTSNRSITSRSRMGRNQQDPIRSALKVGFDVPQRESGGGGEPALAAVSAAKSFASAASRIPGATVEISVQGRTAVLQGTVPSDRERLVAERLALLEPGIERVENRLTVAPPPP